MCKKKWKAAERRAMQCMTTQHSKVADSSHTFFNVALQRSIA
ncbi:hypothetical protein CTATCC11996_02547 [Comamonas testosteroni ATCC 11996]|nr:hypothetical protein CTATCC11996_02547 [Comamonas testosteroni ATCC 11996]